MANPAKTPAGKPVKTRVRVSADVHIYTGLASAPYRRGDTIDLDPDHAKTLAEWGHVAPVSGASDQSPGASNQ